MRKFRFVGVLLAAVLFVGCSGNSMEKDARKLASIMCRSVEMLQDGADPDGVEFQKLTNELHAFEEEMEKKYGDDEEKVIEFFEIFDKELENCRAYKDFSNMFEGWGEELENRLEEGLDELEEGLEKKLEKGLEGVEEALEEIFSFDDE